MTPPFPPRLHVLLAREAPVGLVIRRGPSRRVCTMLWDRRADTFEMGQWLKGRIYERRCDLSPDGRHLLVFALNGIWVSETGGSWTAVSRAPYLKAISLYAKGDTWNGGGLFTGTGRFWLNDGHGHKVIRESAEVRRDRKYHRKSSFGGECLGVYYHRLTRDGWRRECGSELHASHACDVFTKPLAKGLVLMKRAHAQADSPAGKGWDWDEHLLVDEHGAVVSAHPEWEWAERDGDRLVWAEQGKLWAGIAGEQGITDRALLHDFHGMNVEQIRAPY